MGLFDFVGDILGDIGGPIATVASVVTGGFDPISIAINAGLNLIGDAISDGANIAVAASTTSTIGSLAGIIKSITDTIKDIRDALKPVLDTIRDAVKGVTDIVKSINDDILKPILGPIFDTIRIMRETFSLIERQLKLGVDGILAIPQTIANAFSGIDASFQRAAQTLDAAIRRAILDDLTPGLAGAGAVPLTRLSSVLELALPKGSQEWDAPRLFRLALGAEPALGEAALEEFDKKVSEDTGLVGQLVQYAWRFILIAPWLLGKIRAQSQLIIEHFDRIAGITRFDAGTVLDLYGKDIITRETAAAELRTLGYDESRTAALLEGVRRIPSDNQALDWWYRGLINEEGLRKILKVNNWAPEDADDVIAASLKLLSEGDAIAAFHRGLISGADYEAVFNARGWTPLQRETLRNLALRPAPLNLTMDALHRVLLAASSGLFSADEQQAPRAVLDAGVENGFTQSAAQTAWQMHWNILSPSQAVDAMFRGWISDTQLQQFLDAWAIPRAMQQNYIDLQRPLVPYRTVTTLIANGVLSEEDGLNVLRSHGYDDRSAQWLVQVQRAADRAPTPKEADDLAGLTQSTILRLYRAGTIERTEALSLLGDIGIGDAAARASLDLADVEEAASERAAGIDLIIAQADAGLITPDEAVALLGASGASTAETNKALARIAKAASVKTKLPSEGKILDMLRYGILDRAAAAESLAALGYSEGWAELIIALEESRNAGSQQ